VVAFTWARTATTLVVYFLSDNRRRAEYINAPPRPFEIWGANPRNDAASRTSAAAHPKNTTTAIT
jgi:hypothetical protein